MKYIIYFLTVVLPAIKRVAGDIFVFQQDAAINACEKPSVCVCSREGPTFRTLTVAVEQLYETFG